MNNIINDVVHAICPLMKEWSDPKGKRPYKCDKCPASHSTEYGDATQMCYLIAQKVAEKAIETVFEKKQGE